MTFSTTITVVRVHILNAFVLESDALNIRGHSSIADLIHMSIENEINERRNGEEHV